MLKLSPLKPLIVVVAELVLVLRPETLPEAPRLRTIVLAVVVKLVFPGMLPVSVVRLKLLVVSDVPEMVPAPVERLTASIDELPRLPN